MHRYRANEAERRSWAVDERVVPEESTVDSRLCSLFLALLRHSHHARGLSAYFADMETALTARGCMKINLQIVSSNESVKTFYESLGYSTEPDISMGKKIEPNIVIPEKKS